MANTAETIALRYQKCLDTLIGDFSAGDFYREIYEAKKLFFENLGVINEEDVDFENQMDIFMGWYLFDRPLNSFDLPPVILYYRKNKDSIPVEDLSLFKNLTETQHSIYEIIKQKELSLTLRDVSTRKKFEVLNPLYKTGFTRGDIFEARLIPHEGNFCFASGFIFHPREAAPFIETQMKKIRDEDQSQRTKLLLKLTSMKYKHLRFPHIDLNYIYSLEPKF